MLAVMPDEEVHDILTRGARALKAFSNETIADALARVARARQRGYALNERPSMKLRAIALPITNPAGDPFAAFSLCAIASRLKQPRTGEMVELIRREIRTVEEALAAKAHAGSKRLKSL